MEKRTFLRNFEFKKSDFIFSNNKFNLTTKRIFIPTYPHVENFSEEINLFYKNKILERCKTLKKEREKFKNFIWLRKGNNTNQGRVILNQKKIIDMAKKYNFEDLNPNIMNLTDIILCFHFAEKIIIDMGAGIFNLFWCNKNSKLILLNGPHRVRVSDLSIKGHPLFDYYCKNKKNYIISQSQVTHEGNWKFHKFDDLNKILNEI